MIFDDAYRVLCDAQMDWPSRPIDGVVNPFGNGDMPPHRWRVSWDVMQALTQAAPLPWPIENPKGSAGSVKLLFGWPIDVDKAAPTGTLELVPVR